MTPSKITEGLLYASLMKLFFESKKKKGLKNFEKALDFQLMML